jgi:hypothetical protein
MSLNFWRDGNIPEPLYELLPVIYALAGAWVLIVGEGLLAIVSGLLLWLASGLVFMWRRDARLAQSSEKRKVL